MHLGSLPCLAADCEGRLKQLPKRRLNGYVERQVGGLHLKLRAQTLHDDECSQLAALLVAWNELAHWVDGCSSIHLGFLHTLPLCLSKHLQHPYTQPVSTDSSHFGSNAFMVT